MDRTLIAQGVANKLYATENSLDAAMADASQLLASLMQARHDMEVSAIVIDPPALKIAKAISGLAEARQALIEAHGALEEAKLRCGIRAKMVGGFDKNKASFEDGVTVLHERRAS